MIKLNKKENFIIAKIDLSSKIVNQAKFKVQQLVDKKRNKLIKLKDEQKKHYLDMILLFKGLTELFLYLNDKKILLENMIGVIISFKTNLFIDEIPNIEIEYYSGKKIDNFISKLPKDLFLKYLNKAADSKNMDDKDLREIIEWMLNSSEDFLVLSGNVITPALIELNNLSYPKEYMDKLRQINTDMFLSHNLPMKKNDSQFSLILDGLLYRDYLWLIISQLDNYHFSIDEEDIGVIPEELFELATPSTELNIFNTFNSFVGALKEIKCYRQINTFFEESIPNEFLPDLKDYKQYGENAWWYQINDKMDRSRNRGTGFADQMQDGLSLWYKSKYDKQLPKFDNHKSFEKLFAEYMEDWNKVATARQNSLTSANDLLKKDIKKLQFNSGYISWAVDLIELQGVEKFNKRHDVNLPADILSPFWTQSEIDQASKRLKNYYSDFLSKYFNFVAKMFEIDKKVDNNHSLINFIKVYDEISKKFILDKITKQTLNDFILERILHRVANIPKLFGIAYEYKNVLDIIVQDLFDTAETQIRRYFYMNVYFKKLINELIKLYSVFSINFSSDEIYDEFVNLEVYSNISVHATNAKKKNAKLFIIPEQFKELFKKIDVKSGKFASLNDIAFASVGSVFPTYDEKFNEDYFIFNIVTKRGKNDGIIFLLDEEFYNDVITYIPKRWTSFFESIKTVDSNYDKFINIFLATNNEKEAFYSSRNIKLSEATLENYKKFILSLKKYG